MKLTLFPYEGSSPQKIQVIKQIRTLTELGLKPAKEITDSLFEGSQRELEIVLFAPDDPRLRQIVRDLAALGIEVEMYDKHTNAMNEVKDYIKSVISICTEEDEAELLEVMAIAFKMICER